MAGTTLRPPFQVVIFCFVFCNVRGNVGDVLTLKMFPVVRKKKLSCQWGDGSVGKDI